MQVWDPARWRPLARAHRERAEAATAAHLRRRRRGEKHPVWDFLFEYYGFRPGQLARWHPGPGIGLVDADEHAGWRHYRTEDRPEGRVTALDVAGFRAARAEGVRYALAVLRATDAREPQFACFGLHEWAMVYRQSPAEIRHAALPLRLGSAGTNAVVEAHELRCGHFDAVRFFTPAARPRNVLRPARDTQVEHEQPGCLHGGAMDLYRWAFKLSPGVPAGLVLDCLDLAAEARLLDMRSSPYDTRALGIENIPIETPAGKAEHVRQQRAISERAAPLRRRLIAALATLDGGSGGAEHA